MATTKKILGLADLASEQDRLDRQLLNAADAGDPQGIAALLAAGANARTVSDTANEATALCYAAQSSRECVELLLPHSDPKHNGAFGTPLHFAAFSGKSECVQALLPHSDALARDSFGDTALMDAARGSSVRCVELLTPASDANARSERVEHRERNALMLALKENAGPIAGEIARILADATQDLDACDRDGQTALIAGLERALEFDARDMAGAPAYATLLGRVDANMRDARGLTALEWAAEENALEHVKKLLPFTNVAATHEGKCAIDRAVAARAWAVADFLAPFSPREKADNAFVEAGVGDMPAWGAFLEHEELKKTVDAVERAQSQRTQENRACMTTVEAKKKQKRTPRSL